MTEFLNYAIANPVLPVIFMVLLAMLISNIMGEKFRQYQEIDIQGAVSLINNNKAITILDVREIKERKGGHINKDKHIPMAQVQAKITTLDKNDCVLVYCRSGARSASVAQMLGKKEFKAYNLKGGFNAWVSGNMPIAKS